MADCQDFWAQGLWCPAKTLSTLIVSYSVFPWVFIFVQVESSVKPWNNLRTPWEHPDFWGHGVPVQCARLFLWPRLTSCHLLHLAEPARRIVVPYRRGTQFRFFFVNFYTVVLHKYNKYKNNQRTIKHIQSTYTTWSSYDIVWLCSGVCSI